MIQKPSTRVKTAVVYRNCGFVISTTIAAMIRTSPLSCVDSGIVLLDGKDALVKPITVVYPNGCSAMAKMIVVTDRTNCPKIVQSVSRPETSSVKTIDAYPKDGCATLKTIAETIRTNQKICARGSTGSVRNQNSSVPTVSVYPANGDVTTTTIVETIPTNLTVVDSNVKMERSNVKVAIALRRTSVVMATETVEISAMKSDVRQGIPVVVIALRLNSNVKLPNCVFSTLNFVTEKMTVGTVLTKHPTCAVSHE